MTCITCESWALKASRMARSGLASCAHGPRWESWPAQHQCNQHNPLPQDKADARTVWLARVESTLRG